MRHAGIFLTHVKSPRIDAHFERLVDQSAGLIEWNFVYNEGNMPNSMVDPFSMAPELCLDKRYTSMIINGGIINGFLDVLILPLILSVEAEYIWVMEYDVDYSGKWNDFFEQFSDNRSDLLSTTIVSRQDAPTWAHWSRASSMEVLDEHVMHRSFLPIMRLSRKLAHFYRCIVNRSEWQGHFEWVLPTIAILYKFSVEDIGGIGKLCPPSRLGKNYSNDPYKCAMDPGTFIWRPARGQYYMESPESFEIKNFLYHPVKPEVSGWESGVIKLVEY